MGRKTRVHIAMNKPGYARVSEEDGRREGSSHGRSRKGYVPVVVVGPGDGDDGERFLIPAQLMGDPSIVALLEMSAEEFGYGQEGVLRIPCDPHSFREIISHLPFKTT